MKFKPLMIIMLIFLVITITSNVQAATLHGKIYGPDLLLVKNSVVEVNSVPKQNMVSPDGTYSFVLPQGSYVIEAFYTDQGVLLYDSENISVPNEGDFNLDLILFETTNLEDIDFDESEIKMIEELLKEKSKINYWLIAGITFAIAVIIAISYFIYKSRKKKIRKRTRRKFRARTAKEKIEEEKPVGDEVMSKTLAILKREKRVVQKDIRKELGVSEAKVSLVIAELEARGKVQKIKRGRGNIIIYKD